MLLLYASLLLFSFIHHGESAKLATAVLYRDGTNTTGGTLTISQDNSNSPVIVTGTVSGLNNNSGNAHGFHVHTYPVSESFPNCTLAAGHFNPYNTSHGPRTANITNRHVGDLGNITADANGTVSVNITDSIIQLYNITQSIINRTIIIHAMSDDGGTTGVNTSAVTGNSGARVFCGLIKLVSDTAASTTMMNTTMMSTTMLNATMMSTTTTTPSMAIFNTKPTVSIVFMAIIFGYIFI